VAEDYAPFNVDVTTEEPAAPLGAPDGTGLGMRVAIGGSSLDWYGAPAAGIAYVGAFGYDFYQPAYVFPAQLGGGSPKPTADAISHEGELRITSSLV
jgi:hypothetical protein